MERYNSESSIFETQNELVVKLFCRCDGLCTDSTFTKKRSFVRGRMMMEDVYFNRKPVANVMTRGTRVKVHKVVLGKMITTVRC